MVGWVGPGVQVRGRDFRWRDSIRRETGKGMKREKEREEDGKRERVNPSYNTEKHRCKEHDPSPPPVVMRLSQREQHGSSTTTFTQY